MLLWCKKNKNTYTAEALKIMRFVIRHDDAMMCKWRVDINDEEYDATYTLEEAQQIVAEYMDGGKMLRWNKHHKHGYYEAHPHYCAESYYVYKNEMTPPWHVYVGSDYYVSADTLPKAKALAYKHVNGK